ncbi:hypothetical protein BYT27DRAFT_7215182 [Phlegmacium glaucopus]|nr:hypothetical protein BYT27DRAFT_7215182 [Phlegmacium glaucopus]
MIFFTYGSFLAVAGIAQVLAAPMLVIPSNAESTPFKIRVGHAGPPCAGKASFISRIPISIFHWEGKAAAIPNNIGRPSHIEATFFAPGKNVDVPEHAHHRKFRFGHAVAMGHGRKPPFLTRIHYSLKNLGRWEGRAVAFVLGCGIGVLLRMVWVIAVVMYRTVRGRSSDEHEYSQITIIEEIVDNTPNSAPPTYTYPVDEKVATVVDSVKAPSTTEESK